MRVFTLNRFVFIFFAFSATGCVKNQLLRLEAQDFSAQAAEATTSGEAFYVDSVRTNQQLHALLFALNRRCVPPSFRKDVQEVSVVPSDQQKVNADASGDVAEAERICLKLHSELDYESYKLEFSSLDFVSSYVSVLAKTAADPELVSGKGFEQASDDLNTLLAISNKDAISEDKIKAISNFLSAIETIAKDANSARTIRDEFKENGKQVQVQLENLAEAMVEAQSDADFDADAANKIRELAIRSMGSQSLSSATRTQLLDSIRDYELRQWRRSREIARCEMSKSVKENRLERFCRAKAAGLVYATAKAHAELGALIAEKPNARQRQRRASLAYRQFIDLVGVFVGLRGAF